MNIKSLIKNQQQKIVLGLGYILVAGIGFSLGSISASSHNPTEIRVEEAFVPLNNTPETPADQLGTTNKPPPAVGPTPAPATGDCSASQIKGNVGASGSKVYHKPGGSFYNRTKAEACFNTEAEAVAAGFRKSSN